MGSKRIRNYEHTLLLYHRMYFIALSIIAILAFSSQILIQNYLKNQQYDTHLINYAAKLRSDSQALVKYALLLEHGKDYKSARKDFMNTYRRWRETHRSLRSGNEFLNIPANENKEIEELFVIVDKPFQEMVEAADNICTELIRREKATELQIALHLENLLKYEKSYLLGMEMIVFDYDRILRNNMGFLQQLEWILFGVLIICLILEALLIFIPLYKKLRACFMELIEAEKKSLELIQEVQETNLELQNSHKELREVNFALEKATYLVKTDAYGNIIHANDKYCAVTRYSMSELRDKPLFYNNMGGERSVIYNHIDDEATRGEVWQGEVFDHASDGTGFWLNVTLMPIFNNKGYLYKYYAICFDITRRKQAEKELQLLTEEKQKRKEEMQQIRAESILAGSERERKRIGTEIHDSIGQMLTALKMRIEMIVSSGGEANQQIKEMHELLSSIIKETRRICGELLPSVLEDFGLAAAIEDLQKNIVTSTPLKVTIENNMESGILSKEEELIVYRILQEAANNTIKHARATCFSITLESDVEEINIAVADDGIGFDTDMHGLYKERGIESRFGLINMKERAQLLGADLSFISDPGQGTIINLRIPLLKTTYGQNKYSVN